MNSVATSDLLRARNAVAMVFALNGATFASWIARLKTTQTDLGLTPGRLGLLLLCMSIGSLVAMPLTGILITRFGVQRILIGGMGICLSGLMVAGVGAMAWFDGAVFVAGAGLALFGLGVGVWDVAMNVEAADVERELRRSIMPRFHAAFSFGTFTGALIGAGMAAMHVPTLAHLALITVAVAAGVLWFARQLSGLPDHHTPDHNGTGTPETSTPTPPKRRNPLQAWTEPRTLLIGVMVLALALTEGAANDWLAIAMVDGHHVAPWMGAATFALFEATMTAGRLAGPIILDRIGRMATLWLTMGIAFVGLLLLVFGSLPVALLGAALWGLGASLGFPVGMSAAADDPLHAAARVSVVSTIGYTAFLVGPTMLGFVGDQVGTLNSLLVIAVILVPSALVVPVLRRRPDAR